MWHVRRHLSEVHQERNRRVPNRRRQDKSGTAEVRIPRLELQAAVIGARLACTIADSLSITISSKYYWTDSRDVLCWLNSDHRRYTQYVAFRVSEILETTDANEWRWLPSKMNVADDGTKWNTSPDLTTQSRWFVGPEFL